MLQLFKSNSPSLYIILPLFILLIWVHAFLNPGHVNITNVMPLWELVLQAIPNNLLIQNIIASLMVILGAFLLNYIVNEHELLQKQSFLPALLYAVFMSCCASITVLHPVTFSNVFILLALHKLLNTYRQKTAFSDVFDTGFYIGIASLFYFQASGFFILALIAIGILRPFIWREWMIIIIGLAVPYLFTTTSYFWFDKLSYWKTILGRHFTIGAFQIHIPACYYFTGVTLIVLSALSLFYLLTGGYSQKIKTQKSMNILIWFAVIACLTPVLSGVVTAIDFSFFVIPFSVFTAGYFLSLRKAWIGEVLFFMLLGSIIYSYWYSC